MMIRDTASAMTTVPRPPEPDMETLEDIGTNYATGVEDFLGGGETDPEKVRKQAMINYFYGYWEGTPLSRNEIKSACGDLNSAFDFWMDEEMDYDWDYVISRLEEELSVEING